MSAAAMTCETYADTGHQCAWDRSLAQQGPNGPLVKSRDWPGFMNGAAKSAERAATGILGGKSATDEIIPRARALFL